MTDDSGPVARPLRQEDAGDDLASNAPPRLVTHIDEEAAARILSDSTRGDPLIVVVACA